MRILYIYPYESFDNPIVMSHLLRISNYINSRKEELEVNIEEQYLDLRHEGLPKFIPQNLISYRKSLRKLLCDIYIDFQFDIVAISCYTSFSYINTVEVASLIKYFINPSAIIVVGGLHPTMCAEDFFPGEIADYDNDINRKNCTPFDYIIQDEGEKPFYRLIRTYTKSLLKERYLMNPPVIMEKEIFENLDELPIIDLSLIKKYKSVINAIYIDFTRGCPYNCKFCPNSKDLIKSYKIPRRKSIKRCIEELDIIKDTKWLSITAVSIIDMIFFVNRNYRNEFFEELDKIGRYPFKIFVSDRVDLCTDNDLENYKKFNITPAIGFESASKKLLYRIGKVQGKKESEIKANVNKYLKRVEEIIIKSNDIDLEVWFFYLLGVPGTDKQAITECNDFFFNQRFNGKSLADIYKINLRFSQYIALLGSEAYQDFGKTYGAKIYYKDWWRSFHEHQGHLAAIVDPSDDLTLKDQIKLDLKIIQQLFGKQMRLKNPYYNLGKAVNIIKANSDILLKLYDDTL